MSKRISREALSGVWSATPTPLTDDMVVDNQSVNRMVAHHCRLGVKDLFLAGTCAKAPGFPNERNGGWWRLQALHQFPLLPEPLPCPGMTVSYRPSRSICNPHSGYPLCPNPHPTF
jgi:hypothetical protein